MNGLISFCDILGYQSFLANNSATEAAIDVLDIINGTPLAVREEFNEIWSNIPGHENVDDHVAEALDHLVFSDTIVLMLPYPEDVTEHWRRKAIAYTAFFSAHLKRKMFLAGLPLRAVIHEGDFITREACLAGTAVVESYQLAVSLGLSALVFSPNLAKSITEAQEATPMFTVDNYDQYFIDYLTPMKGGKEQKMLHFNWLAYMEDSDMKSCVRDPDSFVLKSFWAHRKDCPASVDGKVSATSKLFRRLLIECEILRQPVGPPDGVPRRS